MGLNTQAVLQGHTDLEKLCDNLDDVYGALHVQRRATHSADYWILEFIDKDGDIKVVNVFLRFMAHREFPELGLVNGTLLTMEFGSTSEAVLRSMASGSNAWLRAHEQLRWFRLDKSVERVPRTR